MFKPYTRSLFHYETDADGVCHFSNYFRIAEEAWHHAVRQEFPNLQFAVIESHARYVRPLRFGSSFFVSIQKIETRRSNFEMSFLIEENQLEVAILKIRFVTIDAKTWEVVPLLAELKQKLDTYEHNRAIVHI